MSYEDDFLKKRAIDPEIWAARGCRWYELEDGSVKEAFRAFLPPKKLGEITKIVNQQPGWLMPKHSPPGFPPIVSQLRPKDAVLVNRLPTWHYHSPWLREGEWPVFPVTAGPKLAGDPLWRKHILNGLAAELHVRKHEGEDGEDPYDPENGSGSHKGEPFDGVHEHAPRAAKYILQGGPGARSRIDLHPLALDRLPSAERVFFVLEGTPKNDSVLSAGAAVFSVPSVSCWKRAEIKRFALEYLRGKTVLVVPDADWEKNWQVERQALKVRSVLRRLRIDAVCCAPPFAPPFDRNGKPELKGVDDFFGAGHTLDELVIGGPEPPIDEICDAVRGIDHPLRRRSSVEALENMSLFSDKDGQVKGSFAAFASILGVSKWHQVVPLLNTLNHTFTLEAGSFDVEQRRLSVWNRKTKEWMTMMETFWKETPIVTVNDEYRAARLPRRTLAGVRYEDAAIELFRTVCELARTGTELLQRDAEERRWLRDREAP